MKFQEFQEFQDLALTLIMTRQIYTTKAAIFTPDIHQLADFVTIMTSRQPLSVAIVVVERQVPLLILNRQNIITKVSKF